MVRPPPPQSPFKILKKANLQPHAEKTMGKPLERRISWLSNSLSAENLPYLQLVDEAQASSSPRPPQKSSCSTLFLAIFSAVLYGSCAVAMNFTNKAALMAFPFANALLFFQMIAALVVMAPLRALGAVTFPPLCSRKARQLLPVTLLYAGNVTCALFGLKLLNIPMFSTLKRLTSMMVLLAKWRATREVPSSGVSASVGLVVLGCLVAGAGDLSFDLKGYAFALMSCMLQAAYLLKVEFSGAKQGISTSELLTYNALLSLPFIAVVAVLSGEAFTVWGALAEAVAERGAANMALLLVTCSLAGVALNFSMFLCTNLNSALTTTVVGALKGVVATALGFVLLGGVQIHAVNVVGISLNAAGGLAYTVVKYRARACKGASEIVMSASGSPWLYRRASSGSLRKHALMQSANKQLAPSHWQLDGKPLRTSPSWDVAPKASPAGQPEDYLATWEPQTPPQVNILASASTDQYNISTSK